MSHRPLAIVTGLTVGDYFLWNWSLGGSHDVLALASGLTLPPLAAACLWLLALTAARLLGRATRQAPRQSRSIARSRRALRRATVRAAATPPTRSAGTPATARSGHESSRKLAA